MNKYCVNIGNSEVFRRFVNNSLDYERTSNNLSDGDKVFARVDVKNNSEILVRYQYDNHLGSACLELDEGANIISYEEYHPFGTTSYRAGRSETEVSLKRYKYCGKERDEETGLYYYGARYYAGWLCRWISPEPLKEEYPNLSTYCYCANNPIKYVDPDGEWFWENSNIRQARLFAKKTDGEFSKWKGQDGKKYASVRLKFQNKEESISSSNEDGSLVVHSGVEIEEFVFRPDDDRYYLLREFDVPTYEAKRASASGFLGRTKALLETGDAWAQGRGEYNRNGQAPGILKGVAGLNPLVSVPNSIKILSKEEDIYNVEASGMTDKTFAIIGLIQPFNPGAGISKNLFNKEIIGNIADWTTQGILFANDAGLFDNLKNKQSDEKKNKNQEN